MVNFMLCIFYHNFLNVFQIQWMLTTRYLAGVKNTELTSYSDLILNTGLNDKLKTQTCYKQHSIFSQDTRIFKDSLSAYQLKIYWGEGTGNGGWGIREKIIK